MRYASSTHLHTIQILYADTKKISYDAKDSDALDKLVHYPLLIRWPLGAADTAVTSTNNESSSEGSSSTPQLTLEVSTSLATLALTDVDYERNCSSRLQSTGNMTKAVDEEEIDQIRSPTPKDAVFGKLQKFPTVLGHLAAGECATEVFGVVEEK